MSLVRGHDVHPGTPWVWRDPDPRFPALTCSFCGSVQPEYAEKLLTRDEPTVSGSDWKYGWPHKFYLTDEKGQMWKFYSEHLLEASNFETLTAALSTVLHVTFEYDLQGRMNYKAPSKGYQTWLKNGEREA